MEGVSEANNQSVPEQIRIRAQKRQRLCLLYTSDAADDIALV